MVSTVTTTVTTVTTTVMAGSFALMVTLLLLALLIQKETVSVSTESRWQQFSRALNIAIWPLGLAFIAIAIMEVAKVL